MTAAAFGNFDNDLTICYMEYAWKKRIFFVE